MSNVTRKHEIEERDAAGNLLATYIYSTTHNLSGRQSEDDKRIDVLLPHKKDRKSLAARAFEAFLPAGYPDSVGDDYLQYQIFDSLQAFASSIAGLLSSRAVLEGVGVGNASATPQSALFLSIIQETVSRVATILFAARFGTAIEPECKMYRLLADVFNDVAMVLDCLSPAFPSSVRVGVLVGSSCLRALCGVAAGSSKGCLSAHFARRGNLGEVNAKDSSQETVISLLGMLTGTFVVSHITSPRATWSAMMLLLAVHLAMNYAAVRAVCMKTLNRQRANIVFSSLVATGNVLTPKVVSAREKVFERDGALRWCDGTYLGHCTFGVSLRDLTMNLGTQDRSSGAFRNLQVQPGDLFDAFKQEQYLLWYDNSMGQAVVVLKKDATPTSQLKAWMHAIFIAKVSEKCSLKIVRETLTKTSKMLDFYHEQLVRAGWDLNTVALDTRPSDRISVV